MSKQKRLGFKRYAYRHDKYGFKRDFKLYECDDCSECSLKHQWMKLIDVFDLYSNKSRHISSLSEEEFQASLALALGLSEVVQQESGGITLESMFIDEGFGTIKKL